jgi:TolA-binding protein
MFLMKRFWILDCRFWIADASCATESKIQNPKSKMNTMRTLAVILALIVSVTALAVPPSTCGATDDYGKALCAYQKRNFAEAEAGFRAIAEKGDPDPATIRAVYFLARTQMKRGHFDEAATQFIRIYEMDRAFYATWNCDYLLGECRKAVGKG